MPYQPHLPDPFRFLSEYLGFFSSDYEASPYLPNIKLVVIVIPLKI
jgi:hypothetical protein